MIVTNTTYYKDLPFENYLKMGGTSYSATKETVFVPTEGMKLGTLVHNLILEPHLYHGEQAEIVRPIADKLKIYLGESYKYLQRELAFTADFTHNGMTMPYKGRVDLFFKDKLIVDLKVLAGDLDKSIERFGYDKQLSGYCLGTGCPIGIIIAYNKAKKRIETKQILPQADFWEYQTVQRGFPSKNLA